MSSRYRVVGILWLLQFVNYLDRTSIALAGPSIMRDLHMRPGSFGLVLGAFTLGYAIMQIPGGSLADRFGAKIMLITAPLIWSVFTGITGLVTSLTALLVVRFAFGLGEGASNAAVYKVVGDNFRPEERVIANGIWNTAFALGPACVAPIGAWLIARGNWQGMFVTLTLPGLVVALVCFVGVPPQRNTTELGESSEPGMVMNWSAALRRPSSWLILFAYMTFNIAFWGFLDWMPSYLSISRHINLKALGAAASVPYLFGVAGLIVFGWLGSHVFFKYISIQVSITYLFAAFGLYMTYHAATTRACVVGLSAAAFFLYGGFGPFVSLVLDLAPLNMRAAFSGFVSTGGQIGGFVAPIVIGYVVSSTGSFTLGFIFMIVALCVSSACYLVLAPYISEIRKVQLSISAVAEVQPVIQPAR